jgi:hypothetical protein
MSSKAMNNDHVILRRLALAIGILLTVSVASGCSTPQTSVRATEENPSLVFAGAPENAIVRVDGIEAGLAADYSGERSLSVLPGRHVVEVIADGRVLLREEIFLGAGSIKTMSLSAGE